MFSEKPLGGGREFARRESKLAIPNYAIDSIKKTSEEDTKIKAFLSAATFVVDHLLANSFIRTFLPFTTLFAPSISPTSYTKGGTRVARTAFQVYSFFTNVKRDGSEV